MITKLLVILAAMIMGYTFAFTPSVWKLSVYLIFAFTAIVFVAVIFRLFTCWGTERDRRN